MAFIYILRSKHNYILAVCISYTDILKLSHSV